MELEVQWWNCQLAKDIHQALRDKELRLPSYTGQSAQLNLRRYFTDLISVTSNHFTLCPMAKHLAVYLLDLVMDRYIISMQQLHAVALSCLLLASKFETRDHLVPTLESLNSLDCMRTMNLMLTKESLLETELLLLETFQWNLCLPTAAHFIEYYLSVASRQSDLHADRPLPSLERAVEYTAKYANYFLEISLQDHEFTVYTPSVVAASCVASSRVVLSLSPVWPSRLERLTLYPWEHLAACTQRMLIVHDGDAKAARELEDLQSYLQPGQTLFFVPGPMYSTPPCLPCPPPQFSQHICQPLVGSTHGPAFFMTHPITLQPGVQSHGYVQPIGYIHPLGCQGQLPL